MIRHHKDENFGIRSTPGVVLPTKEKMIQILYRILVLVMDKWMSSMSLEESTILQSIFLSLLVGRFTYQIKGSKKYRLPESEQSMISDNVVSSDVKLGNKLKLHLKVSQPFRYLI